MPRDETVWIDDVATDLHLRTWVKHCPAMKLVTTLDGKIVWANAAFCEWSQYTLNELRNMTWMQISVHDVNMVSEADETKHLDAYNPQYCAKKQLISKGNKPDWGFMTVLRYPIVGQIECCLCTWEPLKNGTATAFTLAMDHYTLIDKRLGEMTAEIRVSTTRSDEENFVLASIRMVQRHPRVSGACLVIALSIFGLNGIVELLQRMGLIQLPVPVQVQQSEAAGTADANRYAYHIASF